MKIVFNVSTVVSTLDLSSWNFPCISVDYSKFDNVWFCDNTSRSIVQQYLKQTISCHLFRKFTQTRLTQIQLTSYSMSNREWTTRSFCQKQRAKRWQTPQAWTKTLNLTTRSTVCCSDAMLFHIKDTRGVCQYASAMRTETAEPPQRTIICESTKYQLADRHNTAADCAFRIEVPDTSDTQGRGRMSESQRTVAIMWLLPSKQITVSQSLDITITKQTKLLFHTPTHTGESKNRITKAVVLNFRQNRFF